LKTQWTHALANISKQSATETVRDLENELRSKGSRCIYNFICTVSKDVKFELTWAN